MNKSLQAFVILCLLGQLFFACQKHKDEVIPDPEPPTTPQPEPAEAPVVLQPGYFVVAPTSRPTSPNGRTSQASADAKFDLGILKASKEFLFMLTNGGDQAIFDVTLTTNKEACEVYPKSIQIVPGKGQTNIMPLLAVGIIHGRQLNGKGIAPALPPGVNTARVTLKGKTISQNDTIDVTAEFTVSVDAKVAGLKVLSNNVEVSVVSGTVNGEKAFNAGGVGSTITLVNTGNVALRPEVFTYQGKKTVIDLQPGESEDITSLVEDFYLNIEFSDTGAILTTPISNRNSETDIARIVLRTY